MEKSEILAGFAKIGIKEHKGNVFSARSGYQVDAEDVYKVFPFAVKQDGFSKKHVDMDNLLPLVVAAVAALAAGASGASVKSDDKKSAKKSAKKSKEAEAQDDVAQVLSEAGLEG